MAQDSSLLDIPVNSLRGDPASLGDHKGKVLLIVNVASKCGLTPQYSGLEDLHERYADRGFAVLGFPCNQFGAQEPGSPEEIATFCSTTYGVTFPMYEKVEVNGEHRHPIYDELDAGARRGGLHGRHPLELREVPRVADRRCDRPLLTDRDARSARAGRRDRGRAELESASPPSAPLPPAPARFAR